MASKETDLEKLLSTFGILSETTNDTSLKYLKTKAQRNASSETYYQRHHHQPSSPKNSPQPKQQKQHHQHPHQQLQQQTPPPPKKNTKFKNTNVPPNQKPSKKSNPNIRPVGGGIKTSKSESQMTIDQNSSKFNKPKPNSNSKSTVADRIFESIANAIAKGDSKFEYLGPDTNNKIQSTSSSGSSNSDSDSSSGRNSCNLGYNNNNNNNQVTSDSEREVQTDNSSSCGGGYGGRGIGDVQNLHRKFSYVQEKEENEEKIHVDPMLAFPPHQTFPLLPSTTITTPPTPQSSSAQKDGEGEQKETKIQVIEAQSVSPIANPFSALFTSTPIPVKKQEMETIVKKEEGGGGEDKNEDDSDEKDENARKNLAALILEAFHVPSSNLDTFQPQFPPHLQSQQEQQKLVEQEQQQKEQQKVEEKILQEQKEEVKITPVKKQSPSPLLRRSSSSSIEEERVSSSSCPSRNSIDEYLSSCDEFRGKSRPFDAFAQDSPTPLSKDAQENKIPAASSPSVLPTLPSQPDDKITIGIPAQTDVKTEIRQEELQSSESQNNNPTSLLPPSQSQDETKKEESSIGFDGFQLFNLIASKICSVTEKMSQPTDSSSTSEVSKDKVVKQVTNEVFKALFDEDMDEDYYEGIKISTEEVSKQQISKDEELESAKVNLQQLFVSLTGQGPAEQKEDEKVKEVEPVLPVQEISEGKEDCAETTVPMDSVPLTDWRIVYIDSCGLRCEPFCIAYDVPF